MIYVIQAGEAGPVKIGVASDVRKRVGSLQTASPAPLSILHVFEGEEAEERALHRRFAAYRQSGEWFAPVPEIVAGDFGLPAAAKPSMARVRTASASEHPLVILLEERGMSQTRLAFLLGITKSAVSHWITGRASASADIVAATCSLLNADPHILRPDLYSAGSVAPAEWWLPIISERTGIPVAELVAPAPSAPVVVG